MISDLLFSLPTWAVVCLIVVFVAGVLFTLVLAAMSGDSDARIERIEQRMIELNRQDVDERARDGIHFDGGWSRR